MVPLTSNSYNLTSTRSVLKIFDVHVNDRRGKQLRYLQNLQVAQKWLFVGSVLPRRHLYCPGLILFEISRFLLKAHSFNYSKLPLLFQVVSRYSKWSVCIPGGWSEFQMVSSYSRWLVLIPNGQSIFQMVFYSRCSIFQMVYPEWQYPWTQISKSAIKLQMSARLLGDIMGDFAN